MKIIDISGQLLTRDSGFLLGTGVLPGTGRAVLGLGGLEALARGVLHCTAWACQRARACCLGVQSPGSQVDSAHGRAG
ncbi:hypothetical protein JCGZ_04547 [Jatropha curcas]|uniref:Uncharacterized protein n=1 Tax=Jatropha curcas TaxID=180498 RepID=A0A067LGY8_JATCU|nr:hypothetical protein JCGZ_04547 [Jatropha curcas]